MTSRHVFKIKFLILYTFDLNILCIYPLQTTWPTVLLKFEFFSISFHISGFYSLASSMTTHIQFEYPTLTVDIYCNMYCVCVCVCVFVYIKITVFDFTSVSFLVVMFSYFNLNMFFLSFFCTSWICLYMCIYMYVCMCHCMCM